MRRRRWRLTAALALAILLFAACIHEANAPARPRASLRLEGTLLVGPGRSTAGLGTYDLATRELTRIRGSSASPDGFDLPAGSFLGGPTSALFMVRSKLFRVEGDQAAPLGPPYPGGTLVGVAGENVVATRCFPGERGVAVLELSGVGRWRGLGPLCGQSVSPDGAEVAVTRPIRFQRNIFGGGQFLFGTKMWAIRVDGSGSRRLLVDLTAIPALPRSMIADPRLLKAAWGRPGIAVAVSNGESGPWALVFVPTSGAPRVIPLGQAQPSDMAWQPGGDLLAFSDCYQCTTFGRNPAHTADIRIFDPRTGVLRTVASASNFVSGLVWSPHGDVVVTGTSDSDLMFADAEGRSLVRRPVDALPEDWAR